MGVMLDDDPAMTTHQRIDRLIHAVIAQHIDHLVVTVGWKNITKAIDPVHPLAM